MALAAPKKALQRARDAWTCGDAIISRLLNSALEQADAEVRIGDGAVDPAASDDGWQHGQVVDKAASDLIDLWDEFIGNLQLLEGHVDPFPQHAILQGDLYSTRNSAFVVPWMLCDSPVPGELTVFAMDQETLSAEITKHVNAILNDPDAVAEHLELMKNHSRRWREWFKKQRIEAEPPDEPPQEIVEKLSPQARRILRFLWVNRKTTVTKLYQHVYGEKPRSKEALCKAVRRLDEGLSKHTKGRIWVDWTPPDVVLKILPQQGESTSK